MGISNEQWAEIEENLKGLFPLVVFLYKGHRISVQKGRLKENVYRLIVYIDGVIRAKDSLDLDGTGFNPLVVLFWRRRERYLYSKKHRDALVRYNKAIGEKRSKGDVLDPERKTVSYQPDFPTAKSIVRQFKKVEGLLLEGNVGQVDKVVGVDSVDGGKQI